MKKRLIYRIVCGLFIAVIVCIITRNFVTPPINSHSCRFWGIVFSEPEPSLKDIIRTHLDSLKSLGWGNPDGWGIGYYLSPNSGIMLPVISRGEPRAPLDPRYDRKVEEMINYVKSSSVAHVRAGSSGPTSGIPDPHPFERRAIHRDFNMLFAHNGTISTDVLLDLINSVNPTYLDSNPPDYSPNYLDSDLYSIFIIEAIDTYLDSTIEWCIKRAVTMLDSALSFYPQLNFVMSDSSTLWALRFGLSLYYYPDTGISNIWVAASQPLDTSSLWSRVPDSTLITLRPGYPPLFTPIYSFGVENQTHVKEGLDLSYPNPFAQKVKITYGLATSSEISLTIYNALGCLVRTLAKKKQESGYHAIIWDGKDNRNQQVPPGIYFCKFVSPKQTITTKLVKIN